MRGARKRVTAGMMKCLIMKLVRTIEVDEVNSVDEKLKV